MILTNAQMFNSLPVLNRAEEKGVLGFAIAQNRRKLATELKEYFTKRDELLREYGTDEGGGKFKLEPDAAQAFAEAMQPYDEMTADVPVTQVTAETFCSGDLTSSQMFILEWMVKEED